MSSTLRFILCLGLSACLGACGGTPEKSYRLSASPSAATGSSASGLSVVVGPVSLPSYIDRAEIVFASGPNEFQIPSDAVWLGSLQENINRTMTANLAGLLHSRNVRSSLVSGAKGRYRVALDIRQFHGVSGREAILDLSWRIQSGASGQAISRHSGSYHEPIVGDGYGPLVEAESRLLEQAARAVASSLSGR
ncbi:MAG: PqiC family protein [Chthoniobacterales bacterium]